MLVVFVWVLVVVGLISRGVIVRYRKGLPTNKWIDPLLAHEHRRRNRVAFGKYFCVAGEMICEWWDKHTRLQFAHIMSTMDVSCYLKVGSSVSALVV